MYTHACDLNTLLVEQEAANTCLWLFKKQSLFTDSTSSQRGIETVPYCM
jgi:hypothetical protein